MKYKNIVLYSCLIIIIIFINGCEPSCGNNKCEVEENSMNCCLDCSCSTGFDCINNTCLSKCGDNICTENEKEFCCKDCGIKELNIYPKEMSSVFINSKFSDDCIIQEKEKEILNETLLLFQYDSLTEIKEKILEINGLNALLEILYDYNPYSSIKEKDIIFHNIFKNYSELGNDEQIYIINTAHILWIENKNILPWSIKNYSKNDAYYLIERDKNTKWGLGEISKEGIKLFPITINLLENSSKEKTIKNVVEWEMKNFFHAYEDYGWRVYNKSSDESINIPLNKIFKERVIDCNIASHILISMLRSINIPTYEKNFNGHSVTFIPDLNLYIHGDYIADFTVNPDILMTKEEIESYTNSKEGYNKFWNENQNKYPNLKRKENKLYIEGILQTDEAKSEENINFIKKRLKEYNLSFKENKLGGIEISSNFIEIKELE